MNLKIGDLIMRNFLILLLPLLLLTACLSSLTTMDTGPGIDKISTDFSESMRWSDFTTAAGYLDSDAREVFLEQFVADDDLRIVDSSFLSIRASKEGDTSAVYILEYYRLPSGTVKKWRWEQQWQLVAGDVSTGGVWLIQNPPPPLPWKK